MNPVKISHYTMTSAVGTGKSAHILALKNHRSGLTPIKITDDFASFAGCVNNLEQIHLPDSLSAFACRNNHLAYLGLLQDDFLNTVTQAKLRYGAYRGAIFMGSSTSGILSTEQAYAESNQFTALPSWYRYAQTQNPASLGAFVAAATGICGPIFTLSTACSSSAKVFGSAMRALSAGVVDYALVGGVDSLCATTIKGFHALQLVDSQLCKPFDSRRRGINLGEAAGFALLERQPLKKDLKLLGVGESSDAHHMSSPHPQGLGAQMAMQKALHQAELNAAQVDYVNLHGTATISNDLAEGKAITQVFSQVPPCSSTKGFTGHTLGAAGILEINYCLAAIEEQLLWANIHNEDMDSATGIEPIRFTQSGNIRHAMSNSFGFGGSNCSVLVGR